MSDDLVAEEIEIDPMLSASTFAAAEQFAVKVAGGGKVVDRKGKVERRHGHERPMSLLGSREAIVEAFVDCGSYTASQ